MFRRSLYHSKILICVSAAVTLSFIWSMYIILSSIQHFKVETSPDGRPLDEGFLDMTFAKNAIDVASRKQHSITKEIILQQSVTGSVDIKVKPALQTQEKSGGKDQMKDVLFPVFVDTKDSTGLGEGGVAVRLNLEDVAQSDRDEYKEAWSKHMFNEYLSRNISVHRSLPDCRTDVCKKLAEDFKGDLQQISVIVIFHNEAWSVLLRTAHSILSRTPDNVLKELLLVDDCSTFDYLKAPLDKYFQYYPTVKIIRLAQRVGLIQARLHGHDAATAPVLVFFDSHIECFQYWSESLLIRIANNPKAVVFPIIDTIQDKTFATLCRNDFGFYGDFTFYNLFFTWKAIPQREKDRRKNAAETFRSPVMPGGLFAITKEFFNYLGTYDPDLDFWGGENMELSFKTWMCGGSLEMDPCSHVAHLFRRRSPIKGDVAAVHINAFRVAEVWMDDYKNYVFEKSNYNTGDVGDVEDRKRLRSTLQCESFQWYLENIFPEKFIPANMTYAGEFKTLAVAGKCLDSMANSHRRLAIGSCHGEGGNQVWYMGDNGQIRQDEEIFLCAYKDHVTIRIEPCSSSGPEWMYREDKTILHVPSGKCLRPRLKDNQVYLADCHKSMSQKWDLQHRRMDLKFPKNGR